MQHRLAESIPKAESEAKINELQLKLSNSVPRAELETIRKSVDKALAFLGKHQEEKQT